MLSLAKNISFSLSLRVLAAKLRSCQSCPVTPFGFFLRTESYSIHSQLTTIHFLWGHTTLKSTLTAEYVKEFLIYLCSLYTWLFNPRNPWNLWLKMFTVPGSQFTARRIRDYQPNPCYPCAILNIQFVSIRGHLSSFWQLTTDHFFFTHYPVRKFCIAHCLFIIFHWFPLCSLWL